MWSVTHAHNLFVGSKFRFRWSANKLRHKVSTKVTKLNLIFHLHLGDNPTIKIQKYQFLYFFYFFAPCVFPALQDERILSGKRKEQLRWINKHSWLYPSDCLFLNYWYDISAIFHWLKYCISYHLPLGSFVRPRHFKWEIGVTKTLKKKKKISSIIVVSNFRKWFCCIHRRKSLISIDKLPWVIDICMNSDLFSEMFKYFFMTGISSISKMITYCLYVYLRVSF